MINIRPVNENEFEIWADLWKQYLTFYQTNLPEAQFHITFARFFEESTKNLAFFALKDGQAVGLLHLIIHSHNWKPNEVVYLQDLYVNEKFRQLGIATQLIEFTYKFADDCGYSNVYWLTQTHNKTARKLYDKIARLADFVKYDRL